MFLRNTVTLHTSANVAPAAARHRLRFSWTCRACAVASLPPMVRPSASDATQPETKTRRPARTTLVKWLIGSGIPGTRISSRRPIPCMAHLVSMYDRSHSERRGAIERVVRAQLSGPRRRRNCITQTRIGAYRKIAVLPEGFSFARGLVLAGLGWGGGRRGHVCGHVLARPSATDLRLLRDEHEPAGHGVAHRGLLTI